MSTAVFGAPEFRARSGRTVTSRSDGSVMFDHANGYLSPASVMDAEEFFQAKRDAELGRWRWPENPDYVVYRGRDDDDTVVVIDERNGSNAVYDRGDSDSEFERWKSHHDAAFAYFEAHPERKPWEEAKPGEVWALTTADGREMAYAVMSVAESGVVFESHDWRYDLDNTQIKSGRRLWPEDAS